VIVTAAPSPRAPLASDTAVPTITFENIVVGRNGRRALDVPRLTLGAGVTALVGANGSGKTTLLHTVAGLLPPMSGTVVVLGRSPIDARGHVAYVLQSSAVSAHLLVTVDETVALARAATRGPYRRLRGSDRRVVRRCMERLDVARLATRQLAELSGGERQRVFVAQGLAQEADVVLLDEPVAGLDLPSAERIHAVVAEERAAGRTVVIATHDLDEAAAADHVVLLAGRVIATGAPRAVLTPDHLRLAYGSSLLDLGDRLVALDDGAHGHHGPDAPSHP
jgi:ABC-type Mn2+/Zn2+ transport system ATPase subunit